MNRETSFTVPAPELSAASAKTHPALHHEGFNYPLAGAVVLLAITIWLSFGVGRYPISATSLLHFGLALFGLHDMPADRFELIRIILVESRLPRICGAMVIGAGLAISGTTFQAVFRNPMVSPGILGVLSGAGFGAALGIVLNLGEVGIQTASFCTGLLAVGLAVTVAEVFGGGSMITLIFGGAVSGALFTAMLSILKYVADPDTQLPDIVFWLLGSLAHINMFRLILPASALAAGLPLLTFLGQHLDTLTMGDDEARTMGVPVKVLRLIVIAIATILSALTVAMAGMIGWVGLIIPHISRLLNGPNNTSLLPLSASLGAFFLLVCDDLSRGLTDQEIPVGVIADLIGVVLFLSVLKRIKRGWRET